MASLAREKSQHFLISTEWSAHRRIKTMKRRQSQNTSQHIIWSTKEQLQFWQGIYKSIAQMSGPSTRGRATWKKISLAYTFIHLSHVYQESGGLGIWTDFISHWIDHIGEGDYMTASTTHVELVQWIINQVNLKGLAFSEKHFEAWSSTIQSSTDW